jgi:putative acetyltransferase
MIEYREIKFEDNQLLGEVMESVLIEYDAVEGGSMLGDPSCFSMYEQYTDKKSVYYIALLDGKLVGGCGVKIIPNQDDDTLCELQRMYLAKEARGKKIGKTLIEMCISKATEFGFKKMYIESFPQMKEAISLYSKNGFYHIDYAIGSTGHDACDVKMLKDLD